MASSTLIFSRWILPFLFPLSLFFSFSLPLLDSFPIETEDIGTMKKSRNEGKIETTSSFTRWSIRAQRGSWHTFVITEIMDILRWRFRRIAHDPSPVAVSRVGHSSEPNEEEPCRRPGKTRFPGNCTRVRNPAAATKVAVDRGFPLPLAHRSCALGPQVLPVLRIISWFLAYRPSLATRDFSDKEIANFQMDFFLFFFNVNSVIYKN